MSVDRPLLPTAALRCCLLLIISIAIAACASAKTVHLWQGSSSGGNYGKPLVLVALERSTQRRVFEDNYVENLESFGAGALPGYSLITTGLAVSKQSVLNAISSGQVDAVMVIRLLGYDEDEKYSPPTGIDYYADFDRFYRHALETNNAGYQRRFEELRLETNLYDGRRGNLIWSFQSLPIGSRMMRHELEEQILITVSALNASGLLAAE